MINVKIKLLTNTAKLPTKAHKEDACFDIYVDEPGEQYKVVKAHSSKNFHTGITSEIPEGYFAAVFSRSGMGFKRDLRLCNSVGVIDSNYRGEWMVKLVNDGEEDQVVTHGDRIGQFCILPVLEVTLQETNSLETSSRDENGFGSTGN